MPDLMDFVPSVSPPDGGGAMQTGNTIQMEREGRESLRLELCRALQDPAALTATALHPGGMLARGCVSVTDAAAAAAASSDLLGFFRRFKSTDEPIGLVLNGQYSLEQRMQGFNDKDRHIVSDIVAAINKVGGIALLCGTAKFRIHKGQCENGLADRGMRSHSRGEMLPDFSKLQQRGFPLIVRDAEHVAGTYRRIPDGAVWRHAMYSLGSRLENPKPCREPEDPKSRGVERYSATCIMLWPTSEAESIAQQTADLNIPWDALLSLVNRPTAPHERDEQRYDVEFAKVQALIERCICRPPTDDQIQKAGKIVYRKLQTLPSDYVFRVGETELARCANLAVEDPCGDVYVRNTPEPSRHGLYALLKLKMLFPRNIQFSFNRAVNQLLGCLEVGLTPAVLCELIEAYEESGPQLICSFLRSAFRAHPNANLLQDLHREATVNSPPDHIARGILREPMLYGFNEIIIAGINARFSVAYLDQRLSALRPREDFVSDKYGWMGLGEPLREPFSDVFNGTGTPEHADRLVNYFEFLAGLPSPYRNHLLSALVKSIELPVYIRSCYLNPDIKAISDIHLDAASRILEKFTVLDLPILPGTANLRETIIKTTLVRYPVDKPERPSYYFPRWTSPPCEDAARCNTCSSINQFLQSDTEYLFSVELPAHQDASHYTAFTEQVNGRRRNFPTYAHQKGLIVTLTERPALRGIFEFMVVKEAGLRYERLRKGYDENVRVRKEVFGRISEPMDKNWRIGREVDRDYDVPDMQLN
ncbi:hypothetical protein DRE_01047 [Drechslerella stenobrocha 248]|uniref:Uncharacterized protein n=1 Tax=Drechslerella stenobrocha 248 TaxID=1043628 RepID=W7HYH3_9PEZI|nr:hypothetical protein DRE_01047 [Drechslerella stenobrocha 248]